ncbi:hypothetical protein PENSPDRAFT_752163 [Peniophora sp. CONT]|nr:hypothetical protein PENSPDRAFT_752163 [Peniophora sp. CONT]
MLAVFAGHETPFLRLWNWKSGRLLVSLEPTDFLAEGFVTSNFAFISDRAFVLTKAGEGPISIHLIAFNHFPSSTYSRPLLRDSIRLCLPRPSYDRNVPYILAKTGSFALPEATRQPHIAATRSRVHIFLVQTLNNNFPLANGTDVAVMVVVKTTALIRLLNRPSDAPKDLPWASWSPGNVRIVEHGEADGLSERAVFGSRVVFSTQYTDAITNTAPWVHFLLDFNVPKHPGGDDDEELQLDGDGLADKMQNIGSAERTIEMGLRPGEGSYTWTEEADATDQLPCVCTRLRTNAFGLGDEVLLDDERFIRRRTFPDSDLEQTTILTF